MNKVLIYVFVLLLSLVGVSAYTNGSIDIYRIDQAPYDTTNDPDSFTNPNNAFDNDDSTGATKSFTVPATSTAQVYLGKTFSSKYVYQVHVVADLNHDANGYTKIILQTYNGTAWNDHTTLITTNNADAYIDTLVTINDNIQGIRIKFDKENTSGGGVGASAVLYSLEYNQYEPSNPHYDFNSTSYTVVVTNSNYTGSFYDYTYSGNISTNYSKNDGTLNGYTFNDGTLNGGVTRLNYSDCINSTYGNCMSFDGVDDYITSTDINLNPNLYSISMWVNHANTIDGEILFTSNEYLIRANSGGSYTCFNSASYDGATTSVVSVGQWAHLTCVYNGSHINAYLNGNLESSTISLAFTPTANFLNLGNNLFAGKFNGSLDEVRIWDTALNSSQIQDEMNSRNPIVPTVASYSFQEDSGTTTYDLNHLVQGNDNTSRWNKAMSFNGSTYVSSSIGSSLTSYTVCGNTQQYSYRSNEQMVLSDGSTFYLGFDPSGYLTFYSGGWQDSNTNLALNTYGSFCLSSNGSLANMYLDNNLVKSFSNSISFPSSFDIGQRTDNIPLSNFNGSIDNVRIYNTSLNSSQISDLYNNQFYDTDNLVADYSGEMLNNLDIKDRNNQICQNCTSNVASNTIVTEGLYTNWYYDSFSNYNNFFTYYIDTSNPSLDVQSAVEVNSYTIDWTQYINYSDAISGVFSCTVDISNGQSTNCSDTSFTIATNGNFTFNVTLIDNALNYNTSHANSLYVNPTLYFNFQTPALTPITNYTFNGINFTNTASFELYELTSTIPTNVTLLFEKVGFEPTNITLELTNTTAINSTYNITIATIQVQIYDRETGNLLTGLTTLTLIDTIGANATTTTGLYNFSEVNFVSGEYHIIAEHTGYSTEVNYFSFTNQEVITVNFYMLNESTPDFGTIKLIAKDEFSKFVDGALCQAKEWKPTQSSYIAVTEGQTNINGEVLLDIELGTKEYIFTCTKEGFTATTLEEIIKTDLSTRTLILRSEETEDNIALTGLTYSLTPYENTLINSTHARIQFNFTDTNQEVTQGCIGFYSLSSYSETLLTNVCANTSSGNLELTYTINNSFELLAKIYLKTNSGNTISIDNYKYDSNISVNNFLQKYNLDIVFTTIAFLLALCIGVVSKNIYIGLIAIDIAVWVSYKIVPLFMPGQAATTITVIIAVIMWGIFRRK